MTTPTPDVRPGKIRHTGTPVETVARAFADLSGSTWIAHILTAVKLLSAVTPVIRQQERERVAFEIDALAENLEMNSAEGDWEEALNAFKDAAAVARSHVQHRTEES
jgi:translation elongation factor EF-1beta